MNKESLLGISWHDSTWIPVLNPGNVLDYFSERSNIFYDRTCNNEIVKMQRLSPDQLVNMTGLEYILLHVQEPVLYIVRKQHRHSPNHTTALADYYIIAGRVYQAPDLGSVVNSRLLNTINHLQSSFEEALSYTRYHPSKGYWWDFKDKESDEKNKKKVEKKEETSSAFQRQRVDMLLSELSKKFPLPLRAVQQQIAPAATQQGQGQQQPSDALNKQNPTTGSFNNEDESSHPGGVIIKTEFKENDGGATKQQQQSGGTGTGPETTPTTTTTTGAQLLQNQTTTTSSTSNVTTNASQSRMNPPQEKKPRLN